MDTMIVDANLPQFLKGDSLFRRGLRRLLNVNQSVPQRSEAEVADEVERNYRWNYWFNLLDGASFWLGISFASASTILPLFINKLTPSPLAIGLLSVIAKGGWFTPQLFTANIVEQLPRKKPVVVNLGLVLERLPFWVMALIAMLAGQLAPALTVTLFLLAYAWHTVGAGIVATAWQDLLARCFPPERRGSLLGITSFLGAAAGMVGAGVSARILKVYAFPTNFVYTFLLAALFITISWIFLALVREPVQAVTQTPQSNREFWAKLPGIIRQDHNFRRFIITRMLMSMAGMGSGFITVAALQQWQVSDATVGVYTAVMLGGQTVGYLLSGLIADKFGHKLSLVLGTLTSSSAFAIAWLAPSPTWYYAVFALLGFNMGAAFVSGTLVVLEFCEPERRPTYAGLANTGTGIVGSIAPLIGSGLAALGYSWLFACSAILSLSSIILLQFWVKDPRWEPTLTGQPSAKTGINETEAELYGA
jgi:MFS family permease